jgi:uncharacterized caspase-like protein
MTARAWLAQRIRRERTERRRRGREIGWLQAELRRLNNKVIPELWAEAAKSKTTKRALDDMVKTKQRVEFLRHQLRQGPSVEAAIAAAEAELGISTKTAYRALAAMYEEDETREDLGALEDQEPSATFSLEDGPPEKL